MIKKLLPILSLILALTMFLVMAMPIGADQAPFGASNNDLNISISVLNSGTFHIGDTIQYKVRVWVSTAADAGWQSGVQVSFDPIVDDPLNPNANAVANHVDDTILTPTVIDLLPGEEIDYTSQNRTEYRYTPTGGQPSRVDLTTPNTTFAMPLAANFVPTVYNTTYPILDHVIGSGNPPNEIAASEYFVFNGVTQEEAIARVWNIEGAHISGGASNASNDKLGSFPVPISLPGTTVHITSSNDTVDAGQHVTLTITENNTGDVDLTSPHVVINKNDAFFMDLVAPPASGDIYLPTDVLNGSHNNHAEVWTWTLDSGAISGPTHFDAYGHGWDDSTPSVDITTPQSPIDYPFEHSRVDIGVNTPGTAVGVQAVLTPTVLPPGGGTADLTFTETNTQTVDLHNIHVTVYRDGVLYTTLTWPPVLSNQNYDQTLAGNHGTGGEEWTWTITGVAINATTLFEAYGYGEYGSNPVQIVTTPGTQGNPDYPAEYNYVNIPVPPPHQTPGLTYWGIGVLIAGFVGLIGFFGYRRMRRTQS
jgi:hypothetical protein